MYLKRKIESYLSEWKSNRNRLPLIIQGARQVGKTFSIRKFAQENYDSVVEINFALHPEYKEIFAQGFKVDTIIRNISVLDNSLRFIPGHTLIFFDELQQCPNAATSLKAFREDGRYDVICSGSLMGLNYKEIESNAVGNKSDLFMKPLDFEEFLWACGYDNTFIEGLYSDMLNLRPLTDATMSVMLDLFNQYLILGGMPNVVKAYFLNDRNFQGTLQMQRDICRNYEEEITKYAGSLDKGKILNVFRKIPIFLGKENKKFQITKVAHGARSREYSGVVEWLVDSGIINICYNLSQPELPLKANYNPDCFKIYFKDSGLLVSQLDEESQADLRFNKNFSTYKGALYENIVASMLDQEGYDLFYYRNEKGTLEMDFMVRDLESVIPIEVKAKNGATASLNKLISSDEYPEIHYGIKFWRQNIGFNGSFYTFPYFLVFLLKRFLRERSI